MIWASHDEFIILVYKSSGWKILKKWDSSHCDRFCLREKPGEQLELIDLKGFST